MLVSELTDDDRDWLAARLSGRQGPRVWAVKMAYDPLDDALKVKFNEEPWSRPFPVRSSHRKGAPAE